MSNIGPELPPHLLAKRKRVEEELQQDPAKDAVVTVSGANRSSSPGEAEKRRRVLGPAMPPAPLDQRPTATSKPLADPEDSDSDSDDGFGPAMPTSINDVEPSGLPSHPHTHSTTATEEAPPEKLRRDDWMTMPPTQDDLAARMDPSKQRARGFNTGKGAKGPAAAGAGGNEIWNETPEQRQKRVRDEVMGVAQPMPVGPGKARQGAGPAVDSAAEARTRGLIEKSRGPSLMDRHKEGTKDKEVDDDPSKRAFDREKDIGGGMKIGRTQRKEMLNKAAGFSSKFAGGGYL